MKDAIRFLIMEGAAGPLVVKVGGSLLPDAAKILTCLEETGRPLLVVPGGGPFADMVRFLDLPPDPAHWMAILAMDLFGWYLASGGTPVTHRISIPLRLEILLPYRVLRVRDPLPHSWDVTSDTISAWVASELGLDLLILKPVDGIRRHGRLVTRVTEPLPCSEVDPCLIPFAITRRVRTAVVNARAEGRVRAFLEGGEVPGTVIEPRI